LSVRNEEQAAAIRWWTESGVVHQVYVSPEHRRRHIASKLIYAAGAYRLAKNWPELRADGARTDLGEAMLGDAPPAWRRRVPPREVACPPMTPSQSGQQPNSSQQSAAVPR
jgi:GNAT superfamily N-acetyltransferase